MAFYADDLYTASAGVTIYNYWNPYVTKHDTSSFYNWEQDNLPLYDLEERTHYLWEKLGYPLSAVPAMALLVSASVPTDSPLSSNVFTSVSAAIEALPEIIRMPTLIEVALSGNMGELNLNNIKCEDDGALEIINRGFGSILSSSGGEYYSAGAGPNNYTPILVSALDCRETILNTSALTFSANTASLFPDPGDSAFSRKFIVPRIASNQEYTSHSYAGKGNSQPVFQGVGGLIFSNGRETAFTDSTDTTLDLSTTDFRDNSFINGASYNDKAPINGWMTANALSKISVSNSDGPIYIRGFIVDGSGTETDVGVSVNNCEGLTLEYVGSLSCSRKGFDINNSKVYLRRGSAALRNYNDTSDATRQEYETFGYHIKNSTVELQVDNYTKEVDFLLISMYQNHGLYAINSNIIYDSSSVDDSSDEKGGNLLNVNFNFNEKTGITLVESNFKIDGIVQASQNTRGVDIYESVFSPARLLCTGNQKEGIKANSGSVVLNSKRKSIEAQTVTTQNGLLTNSEKMHPFMFVLNGQHVHVGKNAKYQVKWPETVSNIRGGHFFFEHHGVNTSSNSDVSLPGVLVDGEMSLVGVKSVSENPATGANAGIPGLLFRVDGGGKFRSVGISDVTNSITSFNLFKGPDQSNNRLAAALCADNNSTIDLQGTNVIYNIGIGVLCENNSTLNVTPVKTENNEDYLTSGTILNYNTAPTLLEIHSTRACLVANKLSNINLIDLGNYRDLWETVLTGTDVYDNADYIPNYAEHTASGGVQFFPNSLYDPTEQFDITDAPNINSIILNYKNSARVLQSADTSSLKLIYQQSYNNFATDATGYTTGGECLKAHAGSNVTVKNVNFLTGFNNPDGDHYDASSSPAGCNNLHIWNISDDSKLQASYLSVSGQYPSQTGYTGPRSFFASGELGQGDDSSAVSYGIPLSVSAIDTSTLSVLDHFGSGVEVSGGVLTTQMSALGEIRTGLTGNYYGPNSYLNRGPFRLYFGTPAVMKQFAYVDMANASANPEDNRPLQHMSQGYLLSGPVSAVESLSSTWDDLLIYDNETSSYSTSGYLFPSSVNMNYNPNNIWLDESAAEVFSNAKNATITYTGRGKLLNIYRATTTSQGISHINSGGTSASGLGEGYMTPNIFDLRRAF
ncbi:MAG: hypothetical protein ACXADH_07290 [Candidatus Kariarchaeaceae archaeon]|jgi:hypothetical protein